MHPNETADSFDMNAARSIAIDLAHKAAEEVLRIRSEGSLDMQSKEHHGDVVTEADTASERLIVKGLQQEFPGHAIRGEEEGRQGISSEWEWIIDPVDGTMNFANNEEFGISIGLTHKGEPVLGVILFPHTNELAHAVKGGGSFVRNTLTAEEQPIDFADMEEISLEKAAVNVDFTARDRVAEMRQVYAPIVAKTRYPKVIACCTASILAMLHRSRDAYVHPGATPYDIAAATVIVREAGGYVSGIEDEPLNFGAEHIPVIFAVQSALAQKLQTLLASNTTSS